MKNKLKILAKYGIAVMVGISIGVVVSVATANNLPFLEKQKSQKVASRFASDDVITKWYDTDNGYCIYTIISSEGVGITAIDPNKKQ